MWIRFEDALGHCMGRGWGRENGLSLRCLLERERETIEVLKNEKRGQRVGPLDRVPRRAEDGRLNVCHKSINGGGDRRSEPKAFTGIISVKAVLSAEELETRVLKVCSLEPEWHSQLLYLSCFCSQAVQKGERMRAGFSHDVAWSHR